MTLHTEKPECSDMKLFEERVGYLGHIPYLLLSRPVTFWV